MTIQYRVLQVEDSQDDALFNLRQLEHGGFKSQSHCVDTAAKMRNALETNTWDFILCDHQLPQFNALAALELYKDKGLDIPFIVVSGRVGEVQAIKLIKAGAHECLMKEDLAQLAATVRRELQAAEERHMLKRNHANEALLASIVRDCSNAIFGTTLGGSLVTWNKSAEKLYGYSASEIIGGPAAVLESSAQPAKQSGILQRLRSGQPVATFETVHVRKDKTAIEVALIVSPVKEPGGRLIGASTIAQDISLRKHEEHEHLGLIESLTAVPRRHQDVPLGRRPQLIA